MKASEIKNALAIFLATPKQRITPFIIGKPGVGKSAVCYQFAESEGYDKVIDLRLSQHDNTDVKGIPQGDSVLGFSRWLPPEFMPIVGNPKYMKTDGTPMKVLLLLDELNRAAPDVTQSVFELIYDYAIGGNKLMPTCRVVAAGNYGLADGCDVNEFDTAMNDRLCYLPFDENLSEWAEWCTSAGILPEVISFVKSHPKYFYYETDSDKKIFITPRRWVQFAHVLKDSADFGIKSVASLIGNAMIDGALPIFLQYLTELESLSGADVLKNYSKVKARIEQFELDRLAQLSDGVIQAIEQYEKESGGKAISSKEMINLKEYMMNHLQDDQLLGMWYKICSATKATGLAFGRQFKELDEQFSNLIIKSHVISTKQGEK